MEVPIDRLLIVVVDATGFAVLAGGWVAAFVHAETTGLEERLFRVAIGAVFVLVLLAFWRVFGGIDRGRRRVARRPRQRARS